MSSPGLIEAIRLWMERYATEDRDPRWTDYPPPTGVVVWEPDADEGSDQ